ncbi:MAG: NAD kinase (EC [uncultured Sulfurovum sp.]|uniref:NAD kinase n=1 Tax=uncultured Sulfurovum sp. TaxID=269237 RepID=A0A6S6SGH9_9BACT|nr:MAG: NAD kinase (EC [uncultured Sulfurovum sp.]
MIDKSFYDILLESYYEGGRCDMLYEKSSQMNVAGFVIKPNAPEIYTLYNDIKKKFERRNIKVLLVEHSAKMISVLGGVTFDELCIKSDFLVSLGGDGTLLSLVRKSYGYHKPVMGINAGTLGFLADVRISEVDKFLDDLLIGRYRIDNRMMIDAYIQTANGRKKFYAFNDVVITRPSISHMVKIDASIDGEWFNTYRGDGLIISTPTGATAYNLAAGGPLVYPLAKAFVMTPIAAHSLTQRPLVLPSNFTIDFSSPKDRVIVMVDGQDDYQMKAGEVLVVNSAEIGARLLHKKERNYFSVLREKLHWGEKE